MTDTPRLNLPLLLAAQAQKHVTVNEALMRLDGAVNLVLQSATLATPPSAPGEGMAWAVPLGAVDAWAGKGGQVALSVNGGWVFMTPKAGWRAFVTDAGVPAIHGGTDWRLGAMSLTPSGAGMRALVEEIVHDIVPGAENQTVPVMLTQAMMIGVTARVIAPITGTLTSWKLGSPGAPDRFGHGLGMEAGSWCRGLLSQPMTYWSPEALLLTAEGGAFAGGQLRIAVHALGIELPDA